MLRRNVHYQIQNYSLINIGNETWFLSKTGNDTALCGRTEFDACRTVVTLLKNYFDQKGDRGNLHIISDASFLLNSKIQV